MKANFKPHAFKSTSVYDGIEIEVSNDGSCIRYRYGFYSIASRTMIYGRVSRWQEVRYRGNRPYFIYHGRREFLDEYPRV